MHHKGSPEKPQYNMATHPFHPPPPPSSFCLTPHFQQTFSDLPPPISINSENVIPPLYEGSSNYVLGSLILD